MPVRDSGHAFRSERSLTSQSGSTILSQDGHRKLTSSPQSRATSAATTSILSVLSASLYPIPEVQSQNSGVRDRTPAYGGYLLEQEIKNDGGNFSAQLSPAPLSSGAQNKSPKRSWIKLGEKTKSGPPKKRGRPRKIVNLDNAGPDERRRTQIRLAQRAYRSRKEITISTLENRIAELENAAKRISDLYKATSNGSSR